MEFSQNNVCLIAAKLQELLIPGWHWAGLAGFIVVQQEVLSFEDLPLTKEAIATAHTASSLVFENK